jgi:exoribonuclease-2
MSSRSRHSHSHHQDRRELENLDLSTRAERAARDAGFETRFSRQALLEAEQMNDDLPHGEASIRNLRDWQWSSIDNEESQDLDQVAWCEKLDNNQIRVCVGIADVATRVFKGSAIDEHAVHNTTSLYTGVEVFPMLPERLSNDITSLLPGQDRLAVVTEFVIDESGAVVQSDIYRALVRNVAKLVYESVGDWLGGETAVPPKVAEVAGLETQLMLQWEATQRLSEQRRRLGALDVERPEARAVVVDGKVTGLKVSRKNPARVLIENFMVTANMVLAQFLEEQGLPSIQRVVREPERWPRIMQIAHDYGESLPDRPDAPALSAFLRAQREAAPERFGDLSLAILKLLGRGEYMVVKGAEDSVGHFGLGMHNYAHSTAPNRRFPDLVTQRIVQAHLANNPAPYTVDELQEIAARCSEREAAAQKVERLMRKIAAAWLVGDRIGDIFDAIVTGASPKGVYVRAHHPAVEGRVVDGERELDVGDKVRVRLLRADAERGFIDFEHVASH